MAYSSDFIHIPVIYDGSYASKATLEAITNIMQAHWHVEEVYGTAKIPMIVNDNLPCCFTWSYYSGFIIYNRETDHDITISVLNNNRVTSINICMPNAQNVIMRCNTELAGWDPTYILTAMQNISDTAKPFSTFIYAQLIDGNWDWYITTRVFSMNTMEEVNIITQDEDRFDEVYNTRNLTRAISTNVLYSNNAVYESNDTMFFASLDLEKIQEPKSIIIDGVEFVGIPENTKQKAYNYYFKVESED